MVAPSFLRVQLGLLVAIALGVPAAADELANRAFRVKYDSSGITSLRRTGDVADTDYIAANSALGRVVVRYRTAPNELMVTRSVPSHRFSSGGPGRA